MTVPLSTFDSCPIASRFIDTVDDARSYYRHKLVGDHGIVVKGVHVLVRFNPEEHHHFSKGTPCEKCPGCIAVARDGTGRDSRCFSRDRARSLDAILDTLRNAAVVHQARISGGRVVYGPVVPGSPRMCVVIAPDQGVWFVRTAYAVSAKEFASALRSGRPAPWPPK